jgi:hypothetical protein
MRFGQGFRESEPGIAEQGRWLLLVEQYSE